LADDINSDVSAMEAALNSVNDKMDSISSGKEIEGLFGQEKVIDEKAYVAGLKGELGSWSATVNGQVVEASDLTTSSQIRSVMLVEELKGQKGSVAYEQAIKEMNSELNSLADALRNENLIDSAKDSFGGVVSDLKVQSISSGKINIRTWDGQSATSSFGGIEAGDKVQAVVYGGDDYILKLKKNNAGDLKVDSVYDEKGDVVSGEVRSALGNYELGIWG
jgi:hypothetical protein